MITKEGKRVSGTRVNEDTFSVQLRLPSERFQSSSKLNDLVAYLVTLRGQIYLGGAVKEAEGIR